jgi:uncharacterized protein
MDISGSYTLSAPREQVWNALLDPDMLKRTVPGCESLERTGDNLYAVRMSVGVAGIKGIYHGTLKLLDIQRPDSYRIVVDSTGTRGILHGDGALRLEAQDSGTTVVSYSGRAQLGGTIASIGMRVAGAAANMLIKQYFARLAELLPASAPPAGSPAVTVASVPASTSAGTAAVPVAAVSTPPVETLSAVAAAVTEAPPAPAVPVAPVAPVASVAAPVVPVAPAPGPAAGAATTSARNRTRTIGAVVGIAVIVIVALVIWLALSRA